MAENHYEFTITRRLPNPKYVQQASDYSYDRRDADQRERWLLERAITVTLSDAEYEVVKRALIEHWTKTA